MANENEDYGCVPMKDELTEAIKERDADIPMPSTTTTEELMRPGSGKDVDG